MNQIVVDPSLHEEKSSSLYFAVEARDTPDAFKIFRGQFTFKNFSIRYKKYYETNLMIKLRELRFLVRVWIGGEIGKLWSTIVISVKSTTFNIHKINVILSNSLS